MKLGLLERFIRSGKNSLPENMIVCAASALAGTFYYYEYCYESQFPFHMAMSLIICGLMAAIWLVCAAQSGKDGKVGFVIFSFLYWSVPYIYVLYYASRDNLMEYSKWLAMLDKVARALLYNPFDEVAGRLGTEPVTLAAVMLIAIMAAYFAGFTAKRIFVSRKKPAKEDGYDGEYVMDDEEDVPRDR